MKKPILLLVGTVFFCVIIPVLISVLFYRDNTYLGLKRVQMSHKNYESVNSKPIDITVYNTSTGKVENIDIETFLYGVLSMEMSSEFSKEALKAQAVAARTYIVYKVENKQNSDHNGADICTNPSHCQAYASYDDLKIQKGDKWLKKSYQIIKKAVDETKGQILTYNKEVILPLYFSTSSGMTENSGEVFTMQYPYLSSVDSPYEENSPKYFTKKTIYKKEFIKLLKNRYPDVVISEYDLEDRVQILDRSSAGSVKTIKIGNKELDGKDVRNIFGLNSSNFDLVFDNDKATFEVKGYGHGVGMSQWGAEGMGQKGYSYDEILFHYYTGTDIKDIY